MRRLTREQVREIDRRAFEEYHVPGVVLMENAARAVTDVAAQMLSRTADPRVLILCGGGNNGGDGLAVARHLHNRGVATTLFLITDPAKYRGDALINWKIADAMRIPRLEAFDEVMRREYDLYVDAMFGTGLTDPPRDPAPAIIQHIQRETVLAVDLPSGMDCDTGEPFGACVRAKRTVTFVAEKAGFANPASKAFTGEIIVGDIGCPRELIEEVAKMSPP